MLQTCKYVNSFFQDIMFLGKNCTNCFKIMKAPFPCSTCTKVTKIDIILKNDNYCNGHNNNDKKYKYFASLFLFCFQSTSKGINHSSPNFVWDLT